MDCLSSRAATTAKRKTIAEIDEPTVSPTTDDRGWRGGRSHPVSFMRQELNQRGNRPCADVKTRDAKWVDPAGLVLVGQKPAAKLSIW